MRILTLVLVLVVLQVPNVIASDQADAELWIGRITAARLVESGIVKRADPNSDRFPTVEHVLAELITPWSEFDTNQKRLIIAAVLLYGGPEGGTYELLDRLIGVDKDKALMGLTLDSELLSSRFGVSKPDADRLVKLLNKLKSSRTHP
jgi:hypothetical protein